LTLTVLAFCAVGRWLLSGDGRWLATMYCHMADGLGAASLVDDAADSGGEFVALVRCLGSDLRIRQL
jgi:hypothetical protein